MYDGDVLDVIYKYTLPHVTYKCGSSGKVSVCFKLALINPISIPGELSGPVNVRISECLRAAV